MSPAREENLILCDATLVGGAMEVAPEQVKTIVDASADAGFGGVSLWAFHHAAAVAVAGRTVGSIDRGLVVLAAFVSPYREDRENIKRIVGPEHFTEIFINTPLEECEKRDRKGLYEKARKGIIPEFTGISDPYDIPEHPEIRVDTTGKSPMQAAQEIMLYLLREGYLDTDDTDCPDAC